MSATSAHRLTKRVADTVTFEAEGVDCVSTGVERRHVTQGT